MLVSPQPQSSRLVLPMSGKERPIQPEARYAGSVKMYNGPQLRPPPDGSPETMWAGDKEACEKGSPTPQQTPTPYQSYTAMGARRGPRHEEQENEGAEKRPHGHPRRLSSAKTIC